MERNVDLSFTARKEKGESNYHGYRVHVNRGIKYQKRRRRKKKKRRSNGIIPVQRWSWCVHLFHFLIKPNTRPNEFANHVIAGDWRRPGRTRDLSCKISIKRLNRLIHRAKRREEGYRGKGWMRVNSVYTKIARGGVQIFFLVDFGTADCEMERRKERKYKLNCWKSWVKTFLDALFRW